MANFNLQKFQTKNDKTLEIRHFNLEDLEGMQDFFKQGTEETSPGHRKLEEYFDF